MEPIFEAVLDGERHVARLLRDDPTLSRTRASRDSLQVSLIELLVEHGAAIDRGDRGGATPLHRAVRARGVAAVRRLLALGARTDNALKRSRSSPLHLAVQSTGAGGTAGLLDEQLEIIDLLLEHGADPAATNSAGHTPRGVAWSEAVRKALQERRAKRVR